MEVKASHEKAVRWGGGVTWRACREEPGLDTQNRNLEAGIGPGTKSAFTSPIWRTAGREDVLWCILDCGFSGGFWLFSVSGGHLERQAHG